MSIVIPKKIRQYMRNQQFTVNQLGFSDATILVTEQYVLKVSPCAAEAENEASLLQSWLPDKLPVPKIFEVAADDQHVFVLMERLNHLTAAETTVTQKPQQLMQTLAKSLKQLWEVDINSCPSDQSLKNKLAQARSNVLLNRVAMQQAEENIFGPDNFENPMALLIWLEENQPQEDLVFSHGDLCLPNVFLSRDLSYIKAYIDLGRAGIADRYQDIALVYRSLKHNFASVYDDHKVEEAKASDLFTYLEIVPDWDKINYFILLDELG